MKLSHPARVLPFLAALAATPALAQAAPGDAANQIRLNPPRSGEGSGAAPAGGPAVVAEISPEESLRIFRSAGFASAELVRDSGGDYLRLGFDEAETFLFHLNCTDGRCRSLMFTAFLQRRRGANLDFVNRYNLKTLHTKLARNAAGEIVLTMPASLARGVSVEHLRSLAPFWMQVYRDALAFR